MNLASEDIDFSLHEELEKESPIPSLATHNGTFTLISPKTGEHRTFKVSTVQHGQLEGKRIIGLLTGQDNENDYTSFGFIREDGTIAVWKKHQGSIYERYADLFDRAVYWAGKGVEYLVESRCRRCGRKLSTPESINKGIGPECESYEQSGFQF